MTDEFKNTIATYGPQILKLARGVLRDVHAAEDVAQEVLFKFWQMLQEQGPWKTRSYWPWLRHVTINLCRDRLRKEKREYKVHEMIKVCAQTLPPPSESNDEIIQSIQEFLKTAPLKRSEAFYYVVIAGLTYEETARVAGCAPETVRKHCQLLRADLRAHLKSRFGTPVFEDD